MKLIFSNIRKNWLLSLIFLIYVILIFIVVFKHEPWADEAQAWLLARDSSLLGLLFKNLHYEGHPPLWHLILMLPSRILPYYAISIISALIACAGVYIFLRYSPLPKIVKILLPFTYFVFYQYAVIARNYTLVPILLFLIARIYRDKFDKIFQFTLLACLLANSSIFATLVSMSIMFVHLIDFIKMRSELDRSEIRKQMAAFVIFASAIGLIVIQLWQPEDSSFATSYNFSVRHFMELAPRALNESMTEIMYITIPVLIISLLWFWHNRLLLLYLVSTLSILSLFSVKYYNSWHQGVVFMTWIFVMWLSFQTERDGRLGKLSSWTRMAAVLCLILVLSLQVYWAVGAAKSDFNGIYSSGGAIAEYIRDNRLEDEKIHATTFWSTAIQPYFKKNIFDNHNGGENPSFWLWSKRENRIEDMESMLKAQADLIILGRPPIKEIEGYKYEGIFEGNLYWKNGTKETNHFALFRKNQ